MDDSKPATRETPSRGLVQVWFILQEGVIAHEECAIVNRKDHRKSIHTSSLRLVLLAIVRMKKQ